MPGIRAVLTRDDDYFIPLRERYRIAERAKADLFISLHANSLAAARQRERHRGLLPLAARGHRPGRPRTWPTWRTRPTWWAACRRRPRTTW